MKFKKNVHEKLYELSDICCCVVHDIECLSEESPIAYYLFNDFDDNEEQLLHDFHYSCTNNTYTDYKENVRTLYIEYHFDYSKT